MTFLFEPTYFVKEGLDFLHLDSSWSPEDRVSCGGHLSAVYQQDVGLGAEALRLCPQLSDTWPLTSVFYRVAYTLPFILKELVVIIS